ncbi:hypothetical protein P4O66_017219, partial [Electrophorus voltai]
RSSDALKQVRTWPAGAISALQDCFEQTTWITFKEAATDGGTVNLEKYTASVTGYISKCIDDVTVSKTITTHPNQKPWMTAEVRMLLRTRDSAFRTGDREALRKTRAKLSHAIREAKRAHTQRIHGHFKDTGDTRCMWEGIQAITNYRKTSASSDVRRTLRGVNPRKAAGPDNIQGRVLRECADQLADILTDIFNISELHRGPNMLQDHHHRPCAPGHTQAEAFVRSVRTPTVSCLNDYRPIALTSIIMKCFERLVMRHIKTQLPPSLDPLQFAYRPNRSTDDAISTTLHLALTHLDKKGTYFADDTTMVGLINKDNESAYREEVRELVSWCKVNNLYLNVDKTKEMAVDFRRARRDHSPLAINGSSVEIVKNIKFLGVHIVENLTWTLNTSSITKRAQQRLYFLRKLREAHLPSLILPST